MNALAEIDVVDDTSEFFAPASTDMLDNLLAQYRHQRQRIAEIAGFMAERLAGGAIDYFLEGNQTENRGRYSMSLSAKQLFEEAGAIAALNSAFWSKALALTDVLDLMPQKRRSEWHEQIRTHQAPEFTEETVRATLTDLLNARSRFFAERVDGIFRGLSGEHVTNAPEAFGKRMIIAHAVTSYGTTEHNTCGLINDLRCVIARFMGRQEPRYDASSSVVRYARERPGEWVTIDGGALRIRVYKVGTAHLEVHPEMAWRLNCVLAQLYPLAIPAQFRQRPKRKTREFSLLKRPVPGRVCEILGAMEQVREKIPGAWPERYRNVPNTWRMTYRASTDDAAVLAELAAVIEAIGGRRLPSGWFEFDYPAGDVLAEVAASGVIPDQKAHQFYPTPRGLAERVVELAEIGPGHTVLEPSAGQGGLADLLPQGKTTCVEVSGLNAAVLRAKGHQVVVGDFLALSAADCGQFDRIVMNPPFSEGRAEAHTRHAASMLKPGGKLVAILPSGMRGKDLPGLSCTWSEPMAGQFPGVSIDVVILQAVAA